jgi:hypothetical protein
VSPGLERIRENARTNSKLRFTPHSTSAPSLMERSLTGAHDHASPSIQRTPSRILFAVSQMDQGLAVRCQCCQPPCLIERSNRCANRPLDSRIPAILATPVLAASDVAVGDAVVGRTRAFVRPRVHARGGTRQRLGPLREGVAAAAGRAVSSLLENADGAFQSKECVDHRATLKTVTDPAVLDMGLG